MRLIGAALLLACLALAGLAGAAWAEEAATRMPLNPRRAEVEAQLERSLASGQGARLRARATNDADAPRIVSLEKTAGTYLSGSTTWTATAEGGDGSYEYYFQLISAQPDPDINLFDVIADRGWVASNAFTCRVMAPGSYKLTAAVRDGSGQVAYKELQFTAEGAGYPTVADRVNALVAQCHAAGCSTDYEKALWLHDALVKGASYDYTYTYYAPEGVLLRGTGTCDSYSKAYLKLLVAAGVPCRYVTGLATAEGRTEGHAWNVVRLGGKWYNVDATWDDPGTSMAAESGWENHLYFLLPDALFNVDHTGTSGVSCADYAGNYFIRSGRVSIWTDGLEADVRDAMDAQGYRFEVALPAYYPVERSGYVHSGQEHIVYGLSVYALNRADWVVDGQPLDLEIDYTGKKLTGEIAFDGRLLDLPAGLHEIGEASFEGDGSLLAVRLPAGAAVGARAFADCPGLWKVIVPDTVRSIEATAFSGSGHVTLICGKGSYAETFAKQRGLMWKNEE